MIRWLPRVVLFPLLVVAPLAHGLEQTPPVASVILETVGDGPTQIIKGNAKLADTAFTPASTFKMVIAWAALEEGVAEPSSTFKVADKHVPGAPRTLTLPEAMFYSSNDAFVELASRLPKGALEYVTEYSGFSEGSPPAHWLREGPRAVAHAGTLRVTARQEHAFIVGVMRGELIASDKIQAQLLECLAWPSVRKGLALYGKTGTMSGVAWFNGFGVEGKKARAVTVLHTGSGANRVDAVADFYARFDLPPPKLP